MKFSPGIHDKSTCFQGQKGFTYRRKHDVKCRSLLDKLPPIPFDICPCTQDDFSWLLIFLIHSTFGHYFMNEQCLKDLDESEIKILDECVPGEYTKQEFINLPIDLNPVGKIKSYCVNFDLRCLYVLNETGIIQFCYNKKELTYQNSEEIFVKDHSILGMRLDQSTNNIFYYSSKNIWIINEISKYTKILYGS
ncbi:hypothetical protein HZS_2279, partial [Henneguya salminicola]